MRLWQIKSNRFTNLCLLELKSKNQLNPFKKNKDSDSVDCLVVSCAELVGMFEKDFGLKVEESFWKKLRFTV
jgi:hypothetical protein